MKILDATAGTRTIWFKPERHNKDTIYIDIRPEVRPDIVCDATDTPFQDKTFDMILFDPPHRYFSPTSKPIDEHDPASLRFKYGPGMRPPEICQFVNGAFQEFLRILKDDGVVLFKWNSCGMKLEKIMRYCVGFKPMFGQNFNKIRKQETSRVCFRKDPLQLMLQVKD